MALIWREDDRQIVEACRYAYERASTSERSRADLHGMRVAALWQVLMPVARDIENVRITTDAQHEGAATAISFSHA
ncbi:hypothetical protein [Paraburkholderia piptadeniae]|uniref:hypothetical protein n=1 Tax=Paraburkholderia piptadeniae TaxID=1701573 RepID=UPI000B3FBA70|nr:hypothetical protein [Paraburkholderia piptadeniae]